MLLALVLAPVLPAGCAADRGAEGGPTASPTATTAPVPTSAPLAPPAPGTPAIRTERWIDLAAGDCLADPPPGDPGVVTVTIIDCAAPHRAEAYLRVPVAVDTVVAGVADRGCAAGFAEYTGHSVAGSGFTVSYLIDSDQNRTVDNPMPSTVICLLQAADGQPVTGSARR